MDLHHRGTMSFTGEESSLEASLRFLNELMSMRSPVTADNSPK